MTKNISEEKGVHVRLCVDKEIRILEPAPYKKPAAISWDEIYDRAVWAGFNEPGLVAKDEARCQVRELMMELGHPNPDEDDCPEESIGRFCERLQLDFDDRGNIISMKIPELMAKIMANRT